MLTETEAGRGGIYLETSKGEFFIRENKDGSLDIMEHTFYHMAVMPQTANSLKIQALDPFGRSGDN